MSYYIIYSVLDTTGKYIRENMLYNTWAVAYNVSLIIMNTSRDLFPPVY